MDCRRNQSLQWSGRVNLAASARPLARPALIAKWALARAMGRDDPLTATGLYEAHLAEVFRYVVRRIPRRDEAEDVTAGVFAAAFTSPPRPGGIVRRGSGCRGSRAGRWRRAAAKSAPA